MIEAPITLTMLSLMVELRRQPGSWLPEHAVNKGTARALVERALARWDVEARPVRLVLTPAGRRHVDAACAMRLPLWISEPTSAQGAA